MGEEMANRNDWDDDSYQGRASTTTLVLPGLYTIKSYPCSLAVHLCCCGV